MAAGHPGASEQPRDDDAEREADRERDSPEPDRVPQRPVDAGVREGASPVVHAPFAVGDEDVRRRVEAENENQHDGVDQVEAQREQQSNDDERALVGQPQPSARGGSGCGIRAEGAHAARWGWSPAEAVRLRGPRAAVVSISDQRRSPLVRPPTLRRRISRAGNLGPTPVLAFLAAWPRRRKTCWVAYCLFGYNSSQLPASMKSSHRERRERWFSSAMRKFRVMPGARSSV